MLGRETGDPEFDFGNFSAEEWIAAKGLDQIQAGQVMTLKTLQIDEFDTDTGVGQFTLCWSSLLKEPTFGSLSDSARFDIYVRRTTRPDGHDFYVIRVYGHLTDLANILLQTSDPRYQTPSVAFDVRGYRWSVVADRATSTASVYGDGTLVGTYSLN